MCKDHNILPQAGMIIGEEDAITKGELNYANKGLNSKAVAAVAAALKVTPMPIRSVNFSNNKMKTLESICN
jgi:hypothetical protein